MSDKTNFISIEQMRKRFDGKSVAIVGSGPSAMEQDGKFIDSHDVVIRIQNYKMHGFEKNVGSRTDVHYSFYGASMRMSAKELKADGVKLCMCKLPDGALGFASPWHRQNNKQFGMNYRYVYTIRAHFWFCDVYVPTMKRFMELFCRIKNADPSYPGHQPTTGFACLMEIAEANASSVFVTGFDFFRSKIHNLNQPWKAKNPDDPIRHMPELELDYLRDHWPENWTCDAALEALLSEKKNRKARAV